MLALSATSPQSKDEYDVDLTVDLTTDARWNDEPPSLSITQDLTSQCYASVEGLNKGAVDEPSATSHDLTVDLTTDARWNDSSTSLKEDASRYCVFQGLRSQSKELVESLNQGTIDTPPADSHDLSIDLITDACRSSQCLRSQTRALLETNARWNDRSPLLAEDTSRTAVPRDLTSQSRALAELSEQRQRLNQLASDLQKRRQQVLASSSISASRYGASQIHPSITNSPRKQLPSKPVSRSELSQILMGLTARLDVMSARLGSLDPNDIVSDRRTPAGHNEVVARVNQSPGIRSTMGEAQMSYPSIVKTSDVDTLSQLRPASPPPRPSARKVCGYTGMTSGIPQLRDQGDVGGDPQIFTFDPVVEEPVAQRAAVAAAVAAAAAVATVVGTSNVSPSAHLPTSRLAHHDRELRTCVPSEPSPTFGQPSQSPSFASGTPRLKEPAGEAGSRPEPLALKRVGIPQSPHPQFPLFIRDRSSTEAEAVSQPQQASPRCWTPRQPASWQSHDRTDSAALTFANFASRSPQPRDVPELRPVDVPTIAVRQMPGAATPGNARTMATETCSRNSRRADVQSVPTFGASPGMSSPTWCK